MLWRFFLIILSYIPSIAFLKLLFLIFRSKIEFPGMKRGHFRISAFLYTRIRQFPRFKCQNFRISAFLYTRIRQFPRFKRQNFRISAFQYTRIRQVELLAGSSVLCSFFFIRICRIWNAEISQSPRFNTRRFSNRRIWNAEISQSPRFNTRRFSNSRIWNAEISQSPRFIRSDFLLFPQ